MVPAGVGEPGDWKRTCRSVPQESDLLCDYPFHLNIIIIIIIKEERFMSRGRGGQGWISIRWTSDSLKVGEVLGPVVIVIVGSGWSIV